MKTFSMISTLVLSAALATSSVQTLAETPESKNETKQAVKGAATFYSAAIIGGMAAGPVGFFLGAIGGAHIAEKDKAFIANQERLAANEKEINNLENHLDSSQQRIKNLEKSAANKLEFAVMFATGKDELSEVDLQRIKTLATYLKDNPQLNIRVDGHADPRGTEEYNNLLSQERAKTVIRSFEEQGISEERIVWFAHGSNLSTAYKGDLEAYALERKVDIEVYMDEGNDVAILNQEHVQ